MPEKKNSLQFILSLNDRISKPLRRATAGVQKLSAIATSAADNMRNGFLLGAGAAYSLARFLGPAVTFSSELQNMATGALATGDNLERVRKAALAMNSEMGGGLRANLETLRLTHRLTGLLGDDLAVTARNVRILTGRFPELDQRKVLSAQSQLMRDFGGTTQVAGDALAFLASQNGDLRDELLDSLLEYSPQFRSLGFSLEQLVSATRAGLQDGWSIDKVLDAVKEGGIKLRELGKDQLGALRTLGLEDLVPGIRDGSADLVRVMAKVGDAAGKLNNRTDQFNVIAKIFGSPGEDVGVEAMLSMLKSISGDTRINGAMDEISRGFLDTPLGRTRALAGGLENLALSVGSVLMPALLPLLDAMRTGLKRVELWTEHFPFLTKAVGFAFTGFLALTLAVGVMKVLFAAAHIAALPLIIAFKLLRLFSPAAVFIISRLAMLAWSGAVLLARGVMLAFRGVVLLAAGAMWLYNSALWANPITWIVAGVLALIAAVAAAIYYWDDLKVAISGVVDWFVSKWDWAIKKVRGFVWEFMGPDTLLGKALKFSGVDLSGFKPPPLPVPVQAVPEAAKRLPFEAPKIPGVDMDALRKMQGTGVGDFLGQELAATLKAESESIGKIVRIPKAEGISDSERTVLRGFLSGGSQRGDTTVNIHQADKVDSGQIERAFALEGLG